MRPLLFLLLPVMLAPRAARARDSACASLRANIAFAEEYRDIKKCRLTAEVAEGVIASLDDHPACKAALQGFWEACGGRSRGKAAPPGQSFDDDPGVLAYLEPALGSLAPGRPLPMQGLLLDLSQARYSLEVQDLESYEADLGKVLAPSYQAAFKKFGGNGPAMVTVNMADALGKELFDSASAGISLAFERDPATSKRTMLRRLRASLDAGKASMSPAVHQFVSSLLNDALHASKGQALSPGLKEFLSDPLRSTPIGFWTWDDELRSIFLRDRFLQSSFTFEKEGAAFDALRKLLDETPSARKSYKLYAALGQKLNAPFSKQWLLGRRLDEGQWAFLPAARFQEDRLQQELAANGIPPMDLMDELIKRLRAGTMSFNPQADSGYYDYQQHALEAVLLADKSIEAGKVAFGEKYLKRLEDVFKAGMAKARESHVKSLELKLEPTSAERAPPRTIYIHPFLPLEPLPTAYARYAEGFDFLLRALSSPEIRVGRDAAAYDPYGGKESALARLNRGRRLFYGLELVAADELGMDRARFKRFAGVDAVSAVQEAKEWMARAARSPELARDARFAVPVSVDPPEQSPRMIYCWGTVGISLVTAEIKFTVAPSFEQPADGTSVEVEPENYSLATDQFFAFKVPYEKGPLSREQFRHVLDTSKSLEEARTRLEQGER